MIFIATIFVTHYIDAAILLAAGIIGLFYYPRRVAKDIESGKRSEEDGKQWLKKIKFACYFAILYGICKAVVATFK